jgi:putative ABC transport system substrate-binding protein
MITTRLQDILLGAGTEHDLDNVFTTLVEQRGALLIAADPFFANRRAQVIALSEHHAIPATYQFREFTVAGGLMSYGANVSKRHNRTLG